MCDWLGRQAGKAFLGRGNPELVFAYRWHKNLSFWDFTQAGHGSIGGNPSRQDHLQVRENEATPCWKRPLDPNLRRKKTLPYYLLKHFLHVGQCRREELAHMLLGINRWVAPATQGELGRVVDASHQG